MLNAENQTQKEYIVTLYLDEKQVMEKTVNQFFYIVLKRVKAWCDEKIRHGHTAGYNIQEVKKWHTSAQVPSRVVESEVSMMKLFLPKERYDQLQKLFADYKSLYKSYETGSEKSIRLRSRIFFMYSCIEDEFYMSADVCQETIWKWADELENFDRTGYLLNPCPDLEDLYQDLSLAETVQDRKSISSRIVKLWHNISENGSSVWTKFLKVSQRPRVLSILDLIKNFNLDNQESEVVEMFQNDFMSASSDERFSSVLIKWNDLILWSPWKLDLFKGSCPLPTNSHWESDYNLDFNDFSEEV